MARSNTILVIDDDESILTTVADLLGDEGYTVWTADDGAMALELLAQGIIPAAIVLDMRMPTMDGWHFVKRYRAQTANPAPIIVLTAAADAQLWGEQVSAAVTLAKPFDLDDLLAALKQVCART